MPSVDLGSLANRLIADRALGAVATVTSASTGNPALQRLEHAGLDLLVALQYSHPDQHEQRGPGASRRLQSLADVRRQVDELGLRGRMDLAVVDPFHSYASSLECLELGLDLLRPGGTMLVHDCLPPPHLTGETYVGDAWCGVTFAAFRDLCRSRGLAWFTLAADFGLGVVVASDGRAEPVLPAPPLGETRVVYEQDPYAVMRVVDVADLDEALARVAAGRDVEDLVADFPGWERAPVGEVPSLPPATRIANLERELDRARYELGQWHRPRRQLAGLARSVPAALRMRLARVRAAADGR